MINLTICSRALAGKILNNPKYKIDFLISIGCPDRDPPSGYHRFPSSNKLKLTFFDYITKDDDYVWVRSQPYPPNIQDINRVVNFTHHKIKPVLDTQPSVLIHCEVGISRSPAIAQIVLQELGLSEKEARAKVLEVRPQAVPNEFVLSLYKSL
jgi:predicted protein tyrosine phosphatase